MRWQIIFKAAVSAFPAAWNVCADCPSRSSDHLGNEGAGMEQGSAGSHASKLSRTDKVDKVCITSNRGWYLCGKSSYSDKLAGKNRSVKGVTWDKPFTCQHGHPELADWQDSHCFSSRNCNSMATTWLYLENCMEPDKIKVFMEVAGFETRWWNLASVITGQTSSD